uniref:Uncharacterized protein n=2 Tax=viral metagenome TaxID=1070528 RepID=A0A6M3JXR8_9ZZZZ
MDGGEMKKLLVLAILLIPAMGWGEERCIVFREPSCPEGYEKARQAGPGGMNRVGCYPIGFNYEKANNRIVEYQIGKSIPQYEFKRVSYFETGSAWDKTKEMAQIDKYVNQALRENPGWSLVHFFPMKTEKFSRWQNTDGRISIGNFEFEIIIYLSREVGK